MWILVPKGLISTNTHKHTIALECVYIRQANSTNKPCFEVVNLQSFTQINFQCSRVEKNYPCIKSAKAKNFVLKHA